MPIRELYDIRKQGQAALPHKRQDKGPDAVLSPLPPGEVAAKRRVRVVPHGHIIGPAAPPSPGALTRSDLP